jgi:UDP-glucose 4-epimerase
MNLLVTGGCGYIGSHFAAAALEKGHNVVLFDNLRNSRGSVAARIERAGQRKVVFLQGDVRNSTDLSNLFQKNRIDVVCHFAALKSVGESISNPLEYHSNNFCGTLNLIQAMAEAGISRLVFSSTAAVYGEPSYLPLDETHSTAPITPYGRSKLNCEGLLSDFCISRPDWSVISLRYFNPAGAHPSGLLGEDPNGTPNNLIPYISRVASGKYPILQIFGGDYPTPDGTAVRDYIHVMDLAEGHLAALDHIATHAGYDFANLGTGLGTSVLDVLKTFELVSGTKIPFKVVNRRKGDSSSCFAAAHKASKLFSWNARRSLEDMCRTQWLWEKNQN